MRGVLIFLIVVAACAAFPIPRQAEPKFEDFLKGFLEGIHETKKVEDLLKCLKDPEPIMAKIKQALEYFMKMTIDDLVKGFKLLFEALHELQDMLQPCLKDFKQIQKLMEAIKQMDIMKIILRILANPGAFIHDVTDCIDAFKRLDFYSAGKDIGDILYRLFLARRVTENPILEFVIGFLVGIKEQKTVDDLLKCMKNADQIIDKIMKALMKIMSLKIDDMIKGFQMLFEALLELEMMLRPCLEGFEQFKKLMEAITKINIMKLIMKILQDPIPYIRDFTDIIKSLEEGAYKDAGQDLGDILYRLFLVELAQADPTYDFLKGFLEGIHETKKVEDLLKCMQNIDPIIAKIKKALEYFIKMTVEDLVKGFKLLYEALHDLEEMLKPCLQDFKQIQRLMEAIKQMDIMKIILRILANPGAFIHDVTDCIEALKKLDFYSAGKDIGDILYRLFLARRVSENPILEFVIGFLAGIKEQKTVDDLLKCMKNADQIIDKMKQALRKILSFRVDDMIKGFQMLFEALLELEMMLRPCLEGFDQFKRLMEAISKINVMKIIMKILQDPIPYIRDFTDIIQSLEDGNFKEAGQDLGDILYRLFLTELVQADPTYDFIKGFLEGIHETKKVEDLMKCLKNIDPIIAKIKQALEYFMKMTFDDLMKGFKLLYEALHDLEEMLKPCLQDFKQIQRLMEAIKQMDVIKIILRILANPGAFIQDVKDCIEALKKLDFYSAGKDMGDILYRLFLA
jgi:hypothetical protein